MNDLRLCSSISKKLIACVLLANPLLGAYAQDNADAIASEVISNEKKSNESRVEQALKQQIELEADIMQVDAEEAHREGDYKGAIDKYGKSIEKYQKVSKSEPRILQKIKKSESFLSKAYKEYANVLLIQAEKGKSVELFDQANQMLSESLKYNPDLDEYVKQKKKEVAALKAVAEKDAAIDQKGLNKDRDTLEDQKKWRKERAIIQISHRRYTDAKATLEEILVLDPFDEQAAKMIQDINKRLFVSGRQRRIATIQERIDEVEWKWSLPIRSEVVKRTERQTEEGKIPNASNYDKIQEKLKINIPRYNLKGATIEEAIEKLRALSVEQDPEEKGINIIYMPFTGGGDVEEIGGGDAGAVEEDDPFADDFDEDPVDGGGDPVAGGPAGGGKTFDFDLEEMPIADIIRYISESAGLRYRIDDNAVVLADPREKIDDLVTRYYSVNSATFSTIRETAPEGGDDLVGGITDAGGGEEDDNITSYLESLGIEFPAGAQVKYLEAQSKLVLTNTLSAHRSFEKILSEIDGSGTPQIVIESKFVEVNQTNLDEFGFQWSLQKTGAHNGIINFIPNLEGLGNSLGGDALLPNGNIDNSNIPVDNAAGTTSLAGAGASGLGSGIRDIVSLVTAGTNQVFNPGQLSFTSVLGENQFNTFVKALSQQQNNDVLSAPKVIAQSGDTAIIRVVNERFFPESWEAPTIQIIAQGNQGGPPVLSIQPSLPNFGDARDLGVVLEATPRVDADNLAIELEIKPQVVQFVRLDTTFNAPVFVAGFGNPAFTARYDMPIISARSVETRVKIWDGESIVLGGLIQETAMILHDKVPILSDIPLIGRLFRNDAENRVKRNLLVFVTARLVTKSGLPVRPGEIRGLPDFKRL